jgi:hypothetical protein
MPSRFGRFSADPRECAYQNMPVTDRDPYDGTGFHESVLDFTYSSLLK